MMDISFWLALKCVLITILANWPRGRAHHMIRVVVLGQASFGIALVDDVVLAPLLTISTTESMPTSTDASHCCLVAMRVMARVRGDGMLHCPAPITSWPCVSVAHV